MSDVWPDIQKPHSMRWTVGKVASARPCGLKWNVKIRPRKVLKWQTKGFGFVLSRWKFENEIAFDAKFAIFLTFMIVFGRRNGHLFGTGWLWGCWLRWVLLWSEKGAGDRWGICAFAIENGTIRCQKRTILGCNSRSFALWKTCY